MKKELKIAEDLDCLIVPIGATGYMAREIWNEYSLNFTQHYSKYFSNNNDTIMDQLKKIFALLNGDNEHIVWDEEAECNLLASYVIDFLDLIIENQK